MLICLAGNHTVELSIKQIDGMLERISSNPRCVKAENAKSELIFSIPSNKISNSYATVARGKEVT